MSESLSVLVTQLRDETNKSLGRIEGKLDIVITDVNNLKIARAIEDALAEQRSEQAEAHALSFRWRVGLIVAMGVAAFGALGTLILAIAERVPR
jgi:hypothetical protein